MNINAPLSKLIQKEASAYSSSEMKTPPPKACTDVKKAKEAKMKAKHALLLAKARDEDTDRKIALELKVKERKQALDAAVLAAASPHTDATAFDDGITHKDIQMMDINAMIPSFDEEDNPPTTNKENRFAALMDNDDTNGDEQDDDDAKVEDKPRQKDTDAVG